MKEGILKYLFLLLMINSCQIKNDNIPGPNETFIRYFGGNGEQSALDIELVYNSDSSQVQNLILLGRKSEAGDDVESLYIVRTDVNGNEINNKTFSTSKEILGTEVFGDVVSGQIEPTYDANGNLTGYVVVTTYSLLNLAVGLDSTRVIVYQLSNELDSIRSISINQFKDLDIDGDLVNEQVKSELRINDIIKTTDDGYLLVGAVRGGNETDFNFFALKLDSEFNNEWHSDDNNGSFDSRDDILVRAFENPSGNFACFGYNTAPETDEGNSIGNNFYYLEFKSNGVPVNSNVAGSDVSPNEDDIMNNVIKIPSGYVAVGTAIKDTEDRFAFFVSYRLDGRIEEKVTLTESTQVGAINSEGYGITMTNNNSFVVVGRLPNYFENGEQRNDEIAFIKTKANGEPNIINGSHIQSFGLASGDDSGVDAVTLIDGKIVLLTNVDFGGITLMSLMKINSDGTLDN